MRVRVLAVSTDEPDDSKQLIQELTAGSSDFPIPLLQDKDHKVIDRYGLLNQDSGSLPHPATFVIDKQGIVRWRFVEVNYRQRANNEAILRALDDL